MVKKHSMQVRILRSTIIFSRSLEFFGGVGAAVLGFFIFLWIFIKDASLQHTAKLSDYIVVFFMVAAPGLVAFIGSYAHAIHRRLWALPIVFVGFLGTLFLVVLNAGLNYAFVQDALARNAVFADFLAVILMAGLALINTIAFIISGKSA